jgi:hypothetical protein
MEMSMAETRSTDDNVTGVPHGVNPQAEGVPADADRPYPPPSAAAPHIANAEAVQATPAAPVEVKDDGMRPQPLRKPRRTQSNWILMSAVFLLLFVLVLFLLRPRYRKDQAPATSPRPDVEENAELSNYSAFVAKNKALKGDEYSESILTDEPYAGQAPLAVRTNGPLVSAEIDPQLAALAEALKIRLQLVQGSQALSRGKSFARITKGDFRGFKVNAVENIVDGNAVSGEITVTTPQNGLFKTINHVLEELQRTDFPRIDSELRNAGMEYALLPSAPGDMVARGQLRLVRYWGKPVPPEFLIAGKSVGGIALAMPAAQIKGNLDPSFSVLKRKILVNDAYFDVFKIAGRGEEPLLYVYEKDGLVWGISVVSEIFRTERGIGIGSSLDWIRLNYPAVTLATSDKRPPFIRIAGVDGIFTVQAEGERKVMSILIGHSPEF